MATSIDGATANLSPFSDAHYAALAETASQITKAIEIVSASWSIKGRDELVKSMDRITEALSIVVQKPRSTCADPNCDCWRESR